MIYFVRSSHGTFIMDREVSDVQVGDCILPDRLKKPFQEYVDQSNIPNLLLSGGAGVGKTTIAKVHV